MGQDGRTVLQVLLVLQVLRVRPEVLQVLWVPQGLVWHQLWRQ